MKELIKYLIVLGLFILTGWFGYECGKIARKYPEPFKPPAIPELQPFLQVEDDGIIGTKTIKAYEEYTFNQYANKFMTKSGGPK